MSVNRMRRQEKGRGYNSTDEQSKIKKRNERYVIVRRDRGEIGWTVAPLSLLSQLPTTL